MTVRVSARDGVSMGFPSSNWSTFEFGKSYQNARLGFMKLIRTRGVVLRDRSTKSTRPRCFREGGTQSRRRARSASQAPHRLARQRRRFLRAGAACIRNTTSGCRFDGTHGCKLRPVLRAERGRVSVARSSLQEIPDAFGDFAGVRYEREVAGVEEADNRARIVALERLRTRRHKERIVLAPHRQKWRLVRAEVFLE